MPAVTRLRREGRSLMARNVGPHEAWTQAGALPATASAVYHHSMTTPTTLTIRTFADRAEAMAHAVLRAGEAPRFTAFDDTIGCPMEQLLGALEWTRVRADRMAAGRVSGDGVEIARNRDFVLLLGG